MRVKLEVPLELCTLIVIWVYSMDQLLEVATSCWQEDTALCRCTECRGPEDHLYVLFTFHVSIDTHAGQADCWQYRLFYISLSATCLIFTLLCTFSALRRTWLQAYNPRLCSCNIILAVWLDPIVRNRPRQVIKVAQASSDTFKGPNGFSQGLSS